MCRLLPLFHQITSNKNTTSSRAKFPFVFQKYHSQTERRAFSLFRERRETKKYGMSRICMEIADGACTLSARWIMSGRLLQTVMGTNPRSAGQKIQRD
jgi:hypothetical protein